ncbi:MAG TPA: MarR family transcriptional regulator [Capillimicrobium sp.]|nr:MarR family transcriptional regulator [Capillimicrobium sp.]
MEPPIVLLVERAAHHALRALDAALPGIGAAEANALGCFGAEDARRVGDLVRATGQRPSTLTGVLDRLEAAGHVDRRPDPADRRAVLAVLTPQGREARDRVLAAMRALEPDLPEDEARALRRALERFAAETPE